MLLFASIGKKKEVNSQQNFFLNLSFLELSPTSERLPYNAPAFNVTVFTALAKIPTATFYSPYLFIYNHFRLFSSVAFSFFLLFYFQTASKDSLFVFFFFSNIYVINFVGILRCTTC